jgi:hypothetical protein
MKDGMTRERRNIERACESWDWARTAGVSAEELRKALMAALQANAAARDDSPRAADSGSAPQSVFANAKND